MNHLLALARTGFLGLAAASIPLLAGCGIDVGVGGSTGTGGGSGGGSSCSATGSGGATSTSTGTGDPTTTTSSTGTGGGTSCGGFTGNYCADDEFCDYPDDSCGFFDSVGTCKPRPMACDKNLILTCGCDGQNHGNSCDANAAGYDVSTQGNCPTPAGQFKCGPHYCDKQTTLCVFVPSDVTNVPDDYSCAPLPAACGMSPSCPCVAGSECGDTCEATSDGGLQVTCHVGG